MGDYFLIEHTADPDTALRRAARQPASIAVLEKAFDLHHHHHHHRHHHNRPVHSQAPDC